MSDPNPYQPGAVPSNTPNINQTPKTSGLAITSLILGIVSIPLVFVCLGFLTALLAIIFGIIGLVVINGSNGMLKGKGMAITGIITSILAAIGYIIFAYLVFEKQGEDGESFFEKIEQAVEDGKADAEARMAE